MKNQNIESGKMKKKLVAAALSLAIALPVVGMQISNNMSYADSTKTNSKAMQASVQQNNQNRFIGLESAKKIAIDNAKATDKAILMLETDFDYEKGRYLYEVEFIFDSIKYDYDIDAFTGEIVKVSKESKIKNANNTKQTNNKVQNTAVETKTNQSANIKNTNTVLSEAKLKEIAFKHAGVNSNYVTDLETEFDYEKGRYVFEIEFEVGDIDYEYDIDAYTGEIIKSKID